VEPPPRGELPTIPWSNRVRALRTFAWGGQSARGGLDRGPVVRFWTSIVQNVSRAILGLPALCTIGRIPCKIEQPRRTAATVVHFWTSPGPTATRSSPAVQPHTRAHVPHRHRNAWVPACGPFPGRCRPTGNPEEPALVTHRPVAGASQSARTAKESAQIGGDRCRPAQGRVLRSMRSQVRILSGAFELTLEMAHWISSTTPARLAVCQRATHRCRSSTGNRVLSPSSSRAAAWRRPSSVAGWSATKPASPAASVGSPSRVNGPARPRTISSVSGDASGPASHVEAAYQLGELLFHWGSAIGEPASAAREPLSRVLAAEPNNLQAALHLARIAARDGRRKEVDSLVAVMSRIDPAGPWRIEMDALRAFLTDDATWQARSIDAAGRQPNGERIVLDANGRLFRQPGTGLWSPQDLWPHRDRVTARCRLPRAPRVGLPPSAMGSRPVGRTPPTGRHRTVRSPAVTRRGSPRG
jgi:hypothetical protein